MAAERSEDSVSAFRLPVRHLNKANRIAAGGADNPTAGKEIPRRDCTHTQVCIS